MRWWRRQSLRRRVVLSSVLLVTVVLVIGTFAVAAVFTNGRLRDVDAQARDESDTLLTLVLSGQLPDVLPVPAGSPVLAQVVSATGDVLAASPSASRTLALAQEGAGRHGDDVRTDEQGAYAGIPLRLRQTKAVLDGRPVRVVVAIPLTDVRRAFAALRTVLLIVVPLLVLGAAAAVWGAAGRALRPVEQLRAAAEQIARDPARAKPGLLPAHEGDDEVARLGRTLDELLGALQQLLRRQTAFVEDAAHELRSPLASLRVQLEVAAAHPHLVDLPQLLGDLGEEAARLSALAEDLLVLARTESGPVLARHPVDLTALADLAGPPVRVLGDEVALRRALDNLLVNARAHAGAVEVSTSTCDGWAELVVDDDGPGIAPSDRERVFDRWVRLDTARDRGTGGAGLGLSLVRAVARRHDGDVDVLDSPLGGARLRLRLPAEQQPRGA